MNVIHVPSKCGSSAYRVAGLWFQNAPDKLMDEVVIIFVCFLPLWDAELVDDLREGFRAVSFPRLLYWGEALVELLQNVLQVGII